MFGNLGMFQSSAAALAEVKAQHRGHACQPVLRSSSQRLTGTLMISKPRGSRLE